MLSKNMSAHSGTQISPWGHFSPSDLKAILALISKLALKIALNFTYQIAQFWGLNLKQSFSIYSALMM